MISKIKRNKIVVGLLVLALIYVVGFNSLNKGLLSIMGASPSEASMSDASDSNATGSDASESQATNSNEEIGDVTVPSDNVLLVDNLFLDEATSVTAGELTQLSFSYFGSQITGGEVKLLYRNGLETVYASIIEQGGSYYIFVPDNVAPGKYTVKSISFESLNSDGSTFTTLYEGEDLNEVNCFKTLQVENPNVLLSVTLNSISLSKSSVKPLDKVYVDYDIEEDIVSMTLYFQNRKGDSVPVYVRSLKDHPYFIVPSDMADGDYKLIFITVEAEDIYATAQVNQNINLKVSRETNNNDKPTRLVFNNDSIDNNVINAIYNSSNDATITLNVDNNKNVSADIFNVIKGTNRKLILNSGDNQMIFIGKDITTIKSIDASILVGDVKQDKQINSIGSGVVLTFGNNGLLPGKATVKIKNNALVKSILKNHNSNLYYYNPTENKFNTIAENIKLSGDYYSFEITHTSKYVLTDYKISSQLVAVDDTMAFQKNYQSYALILMLAGLMLMGSVAVSKKLKKLKAKEEVIEIL